MGKTKTTGRTVTQHGYVLVRVGYNHHLADVRGYAYEHRINAEKRIARALRRGEVVHHIDGDKKNNAPSNLQVVRGNAEHFVLHRRSGKRRRMPGERNPLVCCACGCGDKLRRFDESGRFRKFISGHNPRAAHTQSRIIQTLADGQPRHRIQIASVHGGPTNRVYVCLSKLRRNGIVQRIGHGFWVLQKGVRHG